MKNLVVNGCSFTDDRHITTWASMLAKKFPNISYHNLASGAAGNDYICRSTINFLASNQLDPAETLVMIMWSGTGRKDMNMPGDWWYHLSQDYPCGRNCNDEQYYIFSGGLTNSWTTNKLTKQIFNWSYKLSDPTTLCEDSMLNIVNLENYLKAHGYQYRFTSYVNYWHTEQESNFSAGDYCIGYFCKNYPLYTNYDFANWFFVNGNRDCLAEFARDLGQLDETSHPTTLGHQQFCDEVVWPQVTQLLL
jgi:hypothetical protein